MRLHRTTLAYGAAVVVPLILAAVLVPFRGSFTNTAAALVLVACIVAVAVVGNRLAGIMASVSAAVWFDFFLTQPYQRLAISHRGDIETTVSLLVVGVAVTELAARSRHHRVRADEEWGYVAAIGDLADLGMGSASSAEIITRAGGTLHELLHLRQCRYEVGPSPRPVARIGPDGSVVHASVIWPVHDLGLPGPVTELPVVWRGEVQGRFLLTPTPGWPLDLEPRVVAVALAALVGAALSDAARLRAVDHRV